MKKVLTLSVLSLFLVAEADLMAASKKRRSKKVTKSQLLKKKKVTQKLKKKQSAVTEADLPTDKNKSKFSLKYLADISTSRNGAEVEKANDINGWGLTQQVTAGYAVTKNDKLSLTARVDTSKERKQGKDGIESKVQDTEFNRIYARYMRSSVLSEKTHGIDITPFIDLRYYGDASSRAGSDGLIRPAVSFTKTFGKLSTNVTLLRAKYFTVDSNRLSDADRLDYYNYITFGPSYELSDKISLSLLGEYIKIYNANGSTAAESTDFAVSMGYKFSPAISGSLYLDSDGTLAPGDGGSFVTPGWAKQVNIGASFTFKVL